ncbi:polysaccharide biosynthesis protein [Tomitella fengzijianii]|uniref:polysaccharide biosynthesis protein n=1 Tax=Tomitella fengzijianii TaxID=2597660 RepID=UPI001E43231C|nr:polysaccharide biosynthesis protein [Tomitella fengzijianii]
MPTRNSADGIDGDPADGDAPVADPGAPAISTSTLSRNGMGAVLAATIFAAASGYVVMLLAGRQLGASGYADFTVYWALFFTFVGITNGLMQESTRAVSAEEASLARSETVGGDPTGRSTSPALIAACVGLVMAVLIVATSPLWASRVLQGHEVLGVGVLAVSVWTVAVQATLWGLAAGRGRWLLYACGMAADAALRLIVAVWAVAAGYGIVAFVFATVAGAVSWLLLLSASSGRSTLARRVHEPPRGFLKRTLQAMAASAATSVLIVGFPVLLAGAETSELGDTAGSLLFAVTVTRAPLLVPLTSFQSAIIVYFVERRATMLRALAMPLGAVVAVGAVGAALAWWIGPPLIRLVGEGFDMSGGPLAALVGGAVTTAALMLTGCATLAGDQHRAYAAGWWVATGTAIVILALPWDITVATVTALVVGPLVGIAVHLSAALTAARRTPLRAPDYISDSLPR